MISECVRMPITLVDVELELKGICAKPGDSRFFG